MSLLYAFASNSVRSLLQPKQPLFSNPTTSFFQHHLPTPNLTRSYQVKSSIKLRCEHCYHALRKGRRYILCRKHPRHKQRQG